MDIGTLQTIGASAITGIIAFGGSWLGFRVKRVELGQIERTTSFAHMEGVVNRLEKNIVALETRVDMLQKHVDQCEQEKRDAAFASMNLTRENDQLREMNTRLTRMKDSAVTKPPPN